MSAVPTQASDYSTPPPNDQRREIYAKGQFRSDRNDHFNVKAVYTPFSPEDLRKFNGQIIPADPPCANVPLKNAARVKGHLVLILRGEVSFDVKMQHAVAAGASAVIFANTSNKLFRAEAESVWNIPSVMVDHETYQRVHGRNIIAAAKYFADFEPDRLQSLSKKNVLQKALEEGRSLKLEVTVLNGFDLKNMEFMFDMDPYCEVKVAGESRRTKTHRGGGRTPVWNQKLRFHVNERTERRMELTCFDEETLKAADLVGFNKSIPLDGVFDSGMTEMTVPLTDEDGLPSGKIELALRLVMGPTMEEKKKAKMGVKTCLDVQVTVAGVCKRSKTHKEGGTDPSWLQTLRMPVPRISDGVDSKFMIIEVWDQGEGLLSQDTLLGKHEVFDLTDIIEKGVAFDGAIPLQLPGGGASKAKIKLKIDRVTEVHGQKVEKLGVNKGLSFGGLFKAVMPIGIIATVPWLRMVTSSFFFSLVNVVFALLPVACVGVFFKRRTIVSNVVKSIIGRLLGVGVFEDQGDGHLNFISKVEMADVPITTLFHFLWTGKVTLRDLVIPNPVGFKSAVGTHAQLSNLLLKAESVYIHARLWSFLKPIKHVTLVLIKNFELVISVDDSGKANLQYMAENAGGFIGTIDRLLGKDVVILHQVCLKGGSANLTAKFLGADTQTAVEIDKIEINNIGKNASSDAGTTLVKKIMDELAQSAIQSYHKRSKLEMNLNLDPEAEFGEISDSEEDADLEDLAELGHNASMEDEEDDNSMLEEEEEEEEEAEPLDGEERQPRHIAY